ncbi:MAG: efflux transporter outer membrane subunit [Planctomycetota bacterium]
MSRLGALAAAAALAAGCAVGPDYVAPKTAMPTGWTGSAASATLHTVPALPHLADWWTVFKDPELDSLIQRAMAANLDLDQADARLRQARAARAVAAGGEWPTADASAGYQAGGGGTSGSTGRNQGNSQLFHAGLDAAWEVDIFGGTRRSIEAADADLAAAIEDRRAVLVTLAGEVSLNYFQIRGLQRQIAIAQDDLIAWQDTTRVTQRRHQGGFASRLDVANAEAQVATAQARIPVLENTERQTVYSLGVLLGQPPAALLHEFAAPAPSPELPQQVPIGVPSDLLLRRPDIRRATAQVHAATARIGVATADLYPKFTLTGSIGVQSDQIGSAASWAARFWSFGPSITVPIFHGGVIHANIAVQEALKDQALLTWRQTVLTALQEVESALFACDREQAHHQALLASVSANRQAVDLAMTLYTQGQIDFLNVLAARQSLYTAEDALAQSEQALGTDLVALYKALGGGWQPEQPDAALNLNGTVPIKTGKPDVKPKQ